MTAKLMMTALTHLDQKLQKSVRLIVGGGGALLLAHHFPLSTQDINAVPTSGATIDELAPLIANVAKELGLPNDWLNPFFSTFTHVLPPDYGTRLIDVGKFKWLKVSALSKEDLLIMKCFAARQKDIIHARALLKGGADLKIVKAQIDFLKTKKIPNADIARKFLADLEAFFEDQE